MSRWIRPIILSIALIGGSSAFAQSTAEDRQPIDAPVPDSSAPSAVAEERGGGAAEEAAGEPMGWLGVRITPMPEPLAAQLNLRGREGRSEIGLMVQNLVTDGPADEAGLQQYDILIAVNGEDVPAQPGRFVQQIGRHQPGDRLRLSVIRQARRETLTLTVGRAEPGFGTTYDWKYEQAQPDGVYNEVTAVRTRMVSRDEAGEVRISDLEASEVFNDLPEEVRQKVFQVASAVEPTRRTAVVRDGQTIELSRDRQGRIVVRRANRDTTGLEKAVIRKYSDPAALKTADPDAWKLAQQVDEDDLLKEIGNKALTRSAWAAARPDFSDEPAADVPDADGDAGDPSAGLALDNAEAYHDQIRRYEAFLAEYTRWLKQRVEDGESTDDLPAMWKELLDQANTEQMLPEREFTVDEFGHIVVRIRKSEGDLVITFRNEQEMQEMYPRLYRQYRELIDGEE